MNGPDTIHIILGGLAILACWVAANQVAEMGSRWSHWRRILRLRENPPQAAKALAGQSQRAIMPPSTTILVHDKATLHRKSSSARRHRRSSAAT